MYKIATPIFLLAEMPVHPGSGNDLGYIDNPIQREVHTGYPKIEGSTLKGALRQAFEAKIGKPDFSKKLDFNSDAIKIHRVFGFDDDYSTKKEYPKKETDENKKKSEKDLLHELFGDKKDFAGAIGFSDARILLFPIKSLKGTFAWITCPRVLAKFKKEIKEICKIDFAKDSETNWDLSNINENQITTNSNIDMGNNQVQLDEYIYTVTKNEEVDKLAEWLKNNVFLNNGLEVGNITENLMIVSNDDFADFVKFGTEVATRIKIENETGTVKEGALFTVEYLPSETIMYSLVMFSPEFREKNRMDEIEIMKFFDQYKPDYFQLGGDATLGKGIFALKVPEFQRKEKEDKK